MTDLLAYYRNSLKTRVAAIDALRDGLARRESESLLAARRIAHTLKGTGTSYGFPEITRAARAVLDAPDDALAGAAGELLETLRRVAFGAREAGGTESGT